MLYSLLIIINIVKNNYILHFQIVFHILFVVQYNFKEIDPNNDGWVQPKDFKEKMEQQKSYTA